MWASPSGVAGVERGRFGIFSLLFLFLFCDDVGTLQGHVSQSWEEKREVKAWLVGNLILSLT